MTASNIGCSYWSRARSAVVTSQRSSHESVVPPGGDAPAHLYRTLLVRQGIFVWDNLWFAGQYPLFSYSLLYYLPAPLIGAAWLGLVSIVAAALVFASIVVREWGSLARWP